MKARALFLVASFVCAPPACLFGQIDCSANSPTGTKLICELPVTATNLVPAGGPAALTAAQAAASSINASIGTQLTQLPVPSASVGTVTLQKKGSDSGVPWENLGPILTDRPDTVGRGHVFAGFSYQHFNFNAIDGVNLSAFPVAYTFGPTSADPLVYFGSISNNIKFSLDQYVALMTVGVSKTTDISVVVPVNNVSLGVLTSNFQIYSYGVPPNSSSTTPIWQQYGSPGSVQTAGSASGLGDITVNLKQMIHGRDGTKFAMAAGAAFRFPSGDALNYLGSGALGGNVYGLFEYRAHFAPHLKVSYQWNDASKLVNPTAGTNYRLPGGLQYAAGTDFRVTSHLTLVADILGSQYVNSPFLSAGVLTLTPTPPPSTAPATLNSVITSHTTYTTSNFSGGIKVSPIRHMVFFANVLLQMNNVGLRSDPVPLVGISYNFGRSN